MEPSQLTHNMPITPPPGPAQPADHPQPQQAPARPLPRGVYVPMPAFFTPSPSSSTTSPTTTTTSIEPDSIDIPATQRHTARLLAAGAAGLVVHGSNGEAVHLSRRERRAAIEAVADAVRHTAADYAHGPVPVVAGCSAASVRETLELCREARDAGATHALILPPGYYRGLVGTEGVVGYYRAVADRGALPVVVYNFPAAANGLDLDSDVLLRLAEHPRIVGVKLTCGNTGKLARLVEGAPRVRGGREDFFVAGGSADFILQGLVVGAHGTISGFANLAPRACVRIGELFEQGRLEEARALQHEVAKADWLAIRYGFVGVKAAMPIFHGAGEESCAVPRLPFTRLDKDGLAVKEIREGMAGALAIEERLAAEAAGDQ